MARWRLRASRAHFCRDRNTAQELQFHFPGLPDQIDAETVVRLFPGEAKAGGLIDAARGEQHALRPQRDLAVAALACKADALFGQGAADAEAARFLLHQWVADHGYIVVSADGRGTPGRGRDFERSLKGNFAKVTLADQVEALQALGQRYPELDLSRVGIKGWSFGGYMAALAVLKRPDVFHVGVAGAPVVDWHDYDTHYTERYLDLPAQNPVGYEDSSLLPLAPGLQRPLLIIHGTGDDNVYFFHALKLSDALFRAGKPHDFLPLSGLTHMVPDANVTIRLWERIMATLGNALRP